MFQLQLDSLDLFGSRMIHSKNGSLVDVIDMGILGTTNSPYYFGVIKYSENGDTSFFNINPQSALYQSINDNCESANSTITLTGVYRAIPHNQGGTQDLLLVKTDSLGNEKWRKIIGDSIHFEQGHAVASTPDGGFILGGIKQKEGDFVPWEYQRPWLIKTDSLGNIEWDRFYGPKDTLNLPIYKVITTQDGGYAFVGGVGVKQYVHDADYLPWIVKLDPIGDTLWTRTIYGNGPSGYFTKYKDLIELPDGSLVTCGQQIIPNPDTINFDGPRRIVGVITKYSAQGELIWSRNYSHPENNLSNSSEHLLNSIVATPDGGFAAAGWLYPFPPDTGTQDTWIIKVDSFGCLVQGCEVSSVPQINAPIASLKIYPNPVTENINIEITPSGNQQEFELKLYDILGRLVLTQTLYPYENTVSVTHLKTGVYSYRIGEVWGQMVVK